MWKYVHFFQKNREKQCKKGENIHYYCDECLDRCVAHWISMSLNERGV